MNSMSKSKLRQILPHGTETIGEIKAPLLKYLVLKLAGEMLKYGSVGTYFVIVQME